MGLIELPFQLLVFGVLNTGLITELHRRGGKGDSEFIARLDQRQYGLRTNISVISPRLASHNHSPVAFTPSQENFFLTFPLCMIRLTMSKLMLYLPPKLAEIPNFHKSYI